MSEPKNNSAFRYLDNNSDLDELSDSVKALSHRHRIKILVLLLERPVEYEFFLNVLKIKKTALANHLAILKKNDLIEQHKKGIYLLSDKGFNIIQSLLTNEEKVKFLNGKGSLITYFELKNYFTNHHLASNFLDIQPKFELCWLSYLGSILGLVKSIGMNFDLADIGGYSGYSFRIVMDRQNTHIAGPTAGPYWNDIYLGTEQLIGRKIQVVFNQGSFFPHKQLSIEETNLVQNALVKIKEQINKNNPVILWGIGNPEFGIVYGYNNETIFANTYENASNNKALSLNIREINSPSGIWIIYLEQDKTDEISQIDLDLLALKRAVKILEGDLDKSIDEAWEKINNEWYGKDIDFVCGLQALDIWSNILSRNPLSQFNYEGNAYCGQCYLEGMKLSAQFLNKIGERYKKYKFSNYLLEASILYNSAFKRMKVFIKIFPFLEKKQISQENKDNGAKILQECKSYLDDALEKIRNAITEFPKIE